MVVHTEYSASNTFSWSSSLGAGEVAVEDGIVPLPACACVSASLFQEFAGDVSQGLNGGRAVVQKMLKKALKKAQLGRTGTHR